MAEKHDLIISFETEEAALLAAHIMYVNIGRAGKIRKVNPDARPE